MQPGRVPLSERIGCTSQTGRGIIINTPSKKTTPNTPSRRRANLEAASSSRESKSPTRDPGSWYRRYLLAGNDGGDEYDGPTIQTEDFRAGLSKPISKNPYVCYQSHPAFDLTYSHCRDQAIKICHEADLVSEKLIFRWLERTTNGLPKEIKVYRNGR